MIVDDLDYMKAVSETSNIVGAQYASVSASTIATFGFGYTHANAIASRPNRPPLTSKYTKFFVGPYYAITEAYARSSI